MKKKILFYVCAAALGAYFSCPAFAEVGKASIKGFDVPSTISGTSKFEETPEGLKISVTFKSAPAGNHGIHIHEFGDCGEAGAAAGDHFNPEGRQHGNVEKDGLGKAHAGDLGNIEIGPDGTGKLKVVIPGLALGSGKYNVAGRSIVFHEKEDNFGQPAGNAGGRLACGKISITGKEFVRKTTA